MKNILLPFLFLLLLSICFTRSYSQDNLKQVVPVAGIKNQKAVQTAFGRLKIQSMPVGIRIIIPALKINQIKSKDIFLLDSVLAGIYPATFSTGEKTKKTTIHISTGKETYLFVNLLNGKIDNLSDKAEIERSQKKAADDLRNSNRASIGTTEKQKNADRNPVFTIVEEMPSFPGPENALPKFLRDNIVYPDSARKSNFQGTVYISFLVTAVGGITEIKLLRGIGGGCDEEAMRVVGLMPDWIPGKQNGRAVPVMFNMPVRFPVK